MTMPPTPEDIDAAQRLRKLLLDGEAWWNYVRDTKAKSEVEATDACIAAAISAARERGAREQMEREPLHRAIVEAAMRYEDESGGHEERALFAAVRALKDATQ